MKVRLYIKTVLILIVVFKIGFVNFVSANDGIDGGELYAQRCAACHQANGSGSQVMQAPAIAGLDSAYLVRQINAFQTGLRGAANGTQSANGSQSAAMAAMVKNLTTEQVALVSKKIAAMPVNIIKQGDFKPSFKARGLYSGCSGCHGSQGEGYPELNTPRLANQYSWYIEQQIHDFRNGIRGTHTSDKYGIQMKTMADAIASDEEIKIIVAYIASLGQ